ncbi:hypothetical protein [Paludisphaera rhizosphaerae]|uniref:hypothetical protein n=1 Tax=Paludisphaera rhizosphaerae TaxID=2711216 RepID=UPI0013EC82C1|nr:hypothetical protein [Paludisphaera rhizosphaerae]
MRTEDLYEAIHASPFQPFSVILPSGEWIHLHHPEFAALPKGKRSVTIYPRERGGVRVLDVAMLAGIEYDEPAAAGQVREQSAED